MSGQNSKKTGPSIGALGLASILNPHGSNALAGLVARPEVNGLYYNSRSLVLDGYRFVGCRFDNCSLHVSSLNFELIECVIDEKSTITYGAAATKIIKLFTSRLEWAHDFFPGFVPTKNANGTITISGPSS